MTFCEQTQRYRYHTLTDNTDRYNTGSNNFPYGAPTPFEGDEIPFEWDDKKTDEKVK